MTRWHTLIALALLALPAAAYANGATPVDEAPSTLLFALGAAGVLIGRHAAVRRRNHRDD